MHPLITCALWILVCSAGPARVIFADNSRPLPPPRPVSVCVAPSRCIKYSLGAFPGSLFKTQNVEYFLHTAGSSGLAQCQEICWVPSCPHPFSSCLSPSPNLSRFPGASLGNRVKLDHTATAAPVTHSHNYLLPCSLLPHPRALWKMGRLTASYAFACCSSQTPWEAEEHLSCLEVRPCLG